MPITVVSYLRGIPAKNNNPEKPRVLNNFIRGVIALGDNGIVSNDSVIKSCDVAVIQGFVHEEGKSAPHLTFRKNILDYQKINKKRSLIIDSNLFLYRDPSNSRGYLRYSYDGIFPSTGEYCNDNPDPHKWNKIKKDIGFDLMPWRKKGTHILLCLQRNGGWSMQGRNVVEFFHGAVSELRKHTDRPIVVRTHPGDKKAVVYANELKGKNVILSTSNSLLQDLNNAWATVVFNSSPSVASIIEGVPAFVLDPINSQAREVANLDISQIENPILLDREIWIQKIAQCHWTDSELISGEAWSHLRKYAFIN